MNGGAALPALLAAALMACHGQVRAGSAASYDDDGEGAGGPGCGVERWDVKTGRDEAAARVDIARPQPITVARLVALPRPGDAAPEATLSDTRQPPYERRAYLLRNVTLRSYQIEHDHDYHLVVGEDAATMVVEIPHPGCVDPPSPWREVIAEARRRFEAHFGRRPAGEGMSEVMTVAGVGFFDRVHEMAGGAPNGVELHPVIGLCFGQDCTP